MSVTQDYKILTLTTGEHAAGRHSLLEAVEVWERIAAAQPAHTKFGREVHDTLASLQSALAKVGA